MYFDDELKFEKDLINILTTSSGWENNVLKYKTEEDLIQNWADILYENNNTIERLNDCPLTKTEMHQLIEQINTLRTPLKLNGFINGKSVMIKRDNENDELHFGKEISLKIYDRDEISAGQSRYQIAEQPIFKPKGIYPQRRGDFVLLINGMPVIHIELKKSSVSVAQACLQIEKYSHEGVFTGLFALIQIFVAMNPKECVYFANPGPDGKFNSDYYFHWADFNNNPINDYKKIAEEFLHIPLAHELIGYYTVADNTDGILKVMRSYQVRAASGIADKVAKSHWDEKGKYGGYIWHTTGSGKTMTSFKSANLIANSKNADKVVFLMDRIELGTQSLQEYRNFADDSTSVQATEDTYVLLSKLKSPDPKDTLIVTSIQKMSNITAESAYNQKDIETVNGKRLVFVIDECHRSTFGEMLSVIKLTFPRAVFFGFTGTPIHTENKKKDTTTAMIFGDEIHRYSIADGIRDGNVLGFDPYKVMTYKDSDLRLAVALDNAQADSVQEALANPDKAAIYNYYMDKTKVLMVGHYDNDKYIKGIEDLVPNSQYNCDKHRQAVVNDILGNWDVYSKGGKYHAILATSSIKEAIEYYNILRNTKLKVTALFDQNIDNNEGNTWKEDAVVDIITDYNKLYGTNYNMSSFQAMKKDICQRIAHKKPYVFIASEPEKQINLLIVVDQMLTGFDSKWLNTLYLDKVLKYEGIIQAFSRTNRLCNKDEKPFGLIRYYRKPNTMEKNIEFAFEMYSGDKPLGLFVDKLDKRINKINAIFDGEDGIKGIFESAGIVNFEKNPTEDDEVHKFMKLFVELYHTLEAAKLQGFDWKQQEYRLINSNNEVNIYKLHLDEQTYLVLLQRYKELCCGGGETPPGALPYDIDTYITEVDTGLINSEWMNNRFEKYMKALQTGIDVEKMRADVSKTFATLSQEEQKYANIFLHDIETGNVKVESGKTLRDYITEYQTKAKNDQIHRFAEVIGVDEDGLRSMIRLNLNESNIDEFERLTNLKNTVNYDKAKKYFDDRDKINYPVFRIKQMVGSILIDFIIKGGYAI